VEDDDVGLDAEVAQRRDLGLEMPEGDDVRTVEIQLAVLAALVDIVERLVLVEDVVFGNTAMRSLLKLAARIVSSV